MDLNIVWFALFGVLIIGYAVLDGFDLGVGILSLFARSESERRVHLNAVGPVWDGNEVWLLTGGGALFAAFPGVYATVFSGFYIALVLLLVALIGRAVSFEFRSKLESATWRRVWDLTFGIGSLLPALLFGVAVGNVMHGIPLDSAHNYTGGFFDLLNPYALVIGLMSLTMFTAHGGAYLALKSDGELATRARRAAQLGFMVWGAFLVVASILTWALLPHLAEAGISRAFGWLALILIVGGLILGSIYSRRQADLKAFCASAAAVAGSTLLVGVSLFPRLVPALGDLEQSLTIYNAASTPRTLTVMLVIALIGMPLVIGYTTFIYRVFKGKVQLDDTSY